MRSHVGEVHAHTAPCVYDLYPTYPIPQGQIRTGYEAVATVIGTAIQQGARHVAIDGFGGTLWEAFQATLNELLHHHFGDSEIIWRNTSSCFLSEPTLTTRIAPYLGGNDPIFGKLYEGDLSELFDPDKLRALATASKKRPLIIYGVGAALAGTPALLVYMDVPKNEITLPIPPKSITNLGAGEPSDA